MGRRLLPELDHVHASCVRGLPSRDDQEIWSDRVGNKMNIKNN